MLERDEKIVIEHCLLRREQLSAYKPNMLQQGKKHIRKVTLVYKLEV